MSNLHILVDVLIHLKDTKADQVLIDKFSAFINEYEDISREYNLLFPEEKIILTSTENESKEPNRT